MHVLLSRQLAGSGAVPGGTTPYRLTRYPILDVNRPMTRRANGLLLMAGTLLLASCANNEVDRRIGGLERRIDELRQRVVSLEEAQSNEPRPVQAPCVNPEELRAQIKALWARREALSLNYTDAHPNIRTVDKQIERLEQRLQDSEATNAPCGGKHPADRD